MTSRPAIYAGVATVAFTLIVATCHGPTADKNISEPNKYRESVRLGGEWFLRNQDENFLHYEYSTDEKIYSEKGHDLREMGALWSISELAKSTKDERYRELAIKGLDHFLKGLVPNGGGGLYYAGRSGPSKLGYSAFLLLALINTDYPERSRLVDGLAQGILDQQEADGSFRTMFDAGGDAGEDYYPGEAMTALMRLYGITGEKKYAGAVEKALPYYREYWKGNPNTGFFLWQARAYRMLYLKSRDSDVREHIFSMADFMVARESHDEGCRNFRFVDDVTVAAWSEGMASAYDVARRSQDAERQECYGNYVREAAGYLLEKQVKNSEDRKVIGGLLGSDGKMRVDRNQHFVMGLMDALDSGIMD